MSCFPQLKPEEQQEHGYHQAGEFKRLAADSALSTTVRAAPLSASGSHEDLKGAAAGSGAAPAAGFSTPLRSGGAGAAAGHAQTPLRFESGLGTGLLGAPLGAAAGAAAPGSAVQPAAGAGAGAGAAGHGMPVLHEDPSDTGDTADGATCLILALRASCAKSSALWLGLLMFVCVAAPDEAQPAPQPQTQYGFTKHQVPVEWERPFISFCP